MRIFISADNAKPFTVNDVTSEQLMEALRPRHGECTVYEEQGLYCIVPNNPELSPVVCDKAGLIDELVDALDYASEDDESPEDATVVVKIHDILEKLHG